MNLPIQNTINEILVRPSIEAYLESIETDFARSAHVWRENNIQYILNEK